MLGAGLGAPGVRRGVQGLRSHTTQPCGLPFRPPGGPLPAVAGHPGCPELGLGVGWSRWAAPLGQRAPWDAACLLSGPPARPAAMKIAVIGQSLFGQEVYCRLREEGHEVVGVFTVPDKDGKADPLGEWCPAGGGGSGACGSCGSCMSFPGLKRSHMSTLGPAQGLLTATLFWNKVDRREGWWRRPACTQDPTVQTPQASLSPHPGSERAAGQESPRSGSWT